MALARAVWLGVGVTVTVTVTVTVEGPTMTAVDLSMLAERLVTEFAAEEVPDAEPMLERDVSIDTELI